MQAFRMVWVYLALALLARVSAAQSEALTQARAAVGRKDWSSARTTLQDYLKQNASADDAPAAKCLAVDCLRSLGEDLIAKADSKLDAAQQSQAHDQRAQGEALLAQYRQEGLATLTDDKVTSPDHAALDQKIGASLEGMINRSLVLLDRANALPAASDTSHSRTLREEWLNWDDQYRAEAMKLLSDARLGETTRTRLKNRVRWSLIHLYTQSEYLMQASMATTVTAHPEMAKALKAEGLESIVKFQKDVRPLLTSDLFDAKVMDRLKRRYLLAYAQQQEWDELEAFAGDFAQQNPSGSAQWALGRLNVAIAKTQHENSDWVGASKILDEILACQTLVGDKDDHLLAETVSWRLSCAEQLKENEKRDTLLKWATDKLHDSSIKDNLMKRYRTELK